MSTLRFLLEHQDVTFRRLVAEAWGLDPDTLPLHAPEALARHLEQVITPAALAALPEEAREALEALVRHEGELPWPAFLQRYGPLRPMGPERMRREQPHRHPASPLEALWYRALVGRRLRTEGDEVLEVAFLPRELGSPVREALGTGLDHPPGRPALPEERGDERASVGGPGFLNDLVTVLAGWRRGDPWEALALHLEHGYPEAWMRALLQAWGVLDAHGALNLEQVARLLSMEAGDVLTQAARVWLQAPFPDLALVPGLESLQPLHDATPQKAREWLLEQVGALPRERWWSLEAFVEAMVRRVFEIPMGPVEALAAWRFRLGQEVVGWFSHPRQVAGAWVRFVLTGPAYWLGLVERAGGAFRPSAWLRRGMQGPASVERQARSRLWVRQDGVVMVPAETAWVVRYQVARSAQWLPRRRGEPYPYRWTPESLERARQEGFTVGALLATLQRYGQTLPAWMRTALVRWEQGRWARVQPVVLLEVPEPEALRWLQRSPWRRAIQRVLTPTVAVLQPGSQHQVVQALLQQGYLARVYEG